MRALGIALSCCVLVGCASIDPYQQQPAAQRLQRDDALGDCARLFQASDATIDAAGTRDAQAPRVPGFPYLRVDRALALLARTAAVADDPQRAGEWTAALAALDDDARRIELHNAGRDSAAAADALATCRSILARADQRRLASLLEAAQVPDDYSNSERVVGLYVLTRYPFAAGIRRWQRDTLAEFAESAEFSDAAVATAPSSQPRIP